MQVGLHDTSFCILLGARPASGLVSGTKKCVPVDPFPWGDNDDQEHPNAFEVVHQGHCCEMNWWTERDSHLTLIHIDPYLLISFGMATIAGHGVKLKDVKAGFPLPGQYHFRFKMKWEFCPEVLGLHRLMRDSLKITLCGHFKTRLRVWGRVLCGWSEPNFFSHLTLDQNATPPGGQWNIKRSQTCFFLFCRAIWLRIVVDIALPMSQDVTNEESMATNPVCFIDVDESHLVDWSRLQTLRCQLSKTKSLPRHGVGDWQVIRNVSQTFLCCFFWTGRKSIFFGFGSPCSCHTTSTSFVLIQRTHLISQRHLRICYFSALQQRSASTNVQATTIILVASGSRTMAGLARELGNAEVDFSEFSFEKPARTVPVEVFRKSQIVARPVPSASDVPSVLLTFYGQYSWTVLKRCRRWDQKFSTLPLHLFTFRKIHDRHRQRLHLWCSFHDFWTHGMHGGWKWGSQNGFWRAVSCAG